MTMRNFLTILLAATLTAHAYGQVETNDTLIAIGNLISRGDDNCGEDVYFISKYRVQKIMQGSVNSDTISIVYTYGSIPKLLPEIAVLRLLKVSGNTKIPNYYIDIDIKEYKEKSIIEPKDTFVEVTTIVIFDGKIINKYGYKINEYWIAMIDLTGLQVDSLKGKKVMVTGKLKIVKGNESKNIQSTRGDTKYITEPKFTIVYDSRHPLQKK